MPLLQQGSSTLVDHTCTIIVCSYSVTTTVPSVVRSVPTSGNCHRWQALYRQEGDIETLKNSSASLTRSLTTLTLMVRSWNPHRLLASYTQNLKFPVNLAAWISSIIASVSAESQPQYSWGKALTASLIENKQ